MSPDEVAESECKRHAERERKLHARADAALTLAVAWFSVMEEVHTMAGDIPGAANLCKFIRREHKRIVRELCSKMTRAL